MEKATKQHLPHQQMKETFHRILLEKNGWRKPHREQNMASSRNYLILRIEGFYAVYPEEFQNCYWPVTVIGLLFFPFAKRNNCFLCFAILAHRLFEPKSHLHTRQGIVCKTENLILKLNVLTGPLTQGGLSSFGKLRGTNVCW